MQTMTEEEKMEEGKRMFSIFAARLFEQRVLQAFREKVAQERQMQLLRELEDEDKLSKEREAKKQTQNQKKKDKKKYVASFFSFLLNSKLTMPQTTKTGEGGGEGTKGCGKSCRGGCTQSKAS